MAVSSRLCAEGLMEINKQKGCLEPCLAPCLLGAMGGRLGAGIPAPPGAAGGGRGICSSLWSPSVPQGEEVWVGIASEVGTWLRGGC